MVTTELWKFKSVYCKHSTNILSYRSIQAIAIYVVYLPSGEPSQHLLNPPHAFLYREIVFADIASQYLQLFQWRFHGQIICSTNIKLVLETLNTVYV
jgi:hypothetical protein